MASRQAERVPRGSERRRNSRARGVLIMPHLDPNAVRITEVLDRHRALSLLQIASRAELSVSATSEALDELAGYELVLIDEDGVYSLNVAVLNELLETA
jgi:hypothetical protein